ncbi:MAG: 2-oxo acid dehydrogenase subunit E2 [Anaerolineae bacterium]|nr:2-oxo acid dehydrogenase subunit E2 [Anaerolineae bacterium]
MAVDILMPPLSQTMDTLVLVAWLKKEGDRVAKGEPLFTVETDKATLEVEAPGEGILRVLASPGEEIKAGVLIGRLVAEKDDTTFLPSVGKSVQGEEQDKSRQAEKQEIGLGEYGCLEGENGGKPPAAWEAGREGRVFISPRARRLMTQEGLSPDMLRGRGSGPLGAFIERDVLAMIQRSSTQPATKLNVPPAEITKPSYAQQVKLDLSRRTVARRMLESHTSVPPVTYTREVDVTALVQLRQAVLRRLPSWETRLTYTDFLIFTVSRALVKHPYLNATFDEETFLQYTQVNMALAIDTGHELVAPVIPGAEKKRLAELANARADLVERARRGELEAHELKGATFTLTNLGALGIDHFTPMITPPQVAVLGVGRIRQIAAVFQGEIQIRNVMNLLLTCDHRVIDGAPAARFLDCVAQLLESPELMML